MLFLRILKLVGCPVEGFWARENTPGRFREHFIYQHWKPNVDIMQEGPEPIPRSDQCRMHMPAARIFKHTQTDK